MKTEYFDIQGPVLFTPKLHLDHRGYFMETFSLRRFQAATGETLSFVQDNQSYSEAKHTIRGLHFQSPPHAQGKLVRCLVGSILDVAVDVRPDSKSYGQHVKVVLSEENKSQLWVPSGFLHGFATLEPDTVVAYKCTDYYHSECEGSILFDDPDLNIDWGFDVSLATISEKDRQAMRLKDFQNPF